MDRGGARSYPINSLKMSRVEAIQGSKKCVYYIYLPVSFLYRNVKLRTAVAIVKSLGNSYVLQLFEEIEIVLRTS